MLDAQFSAWAALDLRWQDFLQEYLPRLTLPPWLPSPTDEQVVFDIDVDTAGTCTLKAAVELDNDKDLKLGALELGRRFRIALKVTFDAQQLEDNSNLAVLLSTLHIEVDVGLDIRLQLPDVGLLRAEMGGNDGWLHLDLKAAIGDEELTLTAEADAADDRAFLFALVAFVPGAPSSPILRGGLRKVSITIPADFDTNADASVTMACDGSISLHQLELPDNAPFAYQLQQLFSDLDRQLSTPDQVNFNGTVAVVASATGFAAKIRLQGAMMEIKPFAVLSGITTGGGAPRPAQEMPIDLPIRFSFNGMNFKLTDTPADCVFEVFSTFSIGDSVAEATVSLSGEQFVISIGNMSIPLTIPRFPFTEEDFNKCYDDPGIIDDELEFLLALPNTDKAKDLDYDDKIRKLRIKRALLEMFKRAETGAGYTMGSEARVRYREWLKYFVRAAELPSKIAGDETEAAYRITKRVIAYLKKTRAPGEISTELEDDLQRLTTRYTGVQGLHDALRSALTQSEFDAYAPDIVEYAKIRGETLTATISGAPYILAENLTLTIEQFALRIPLRSPNNIGLDCAATLSAYNEQAGQLDITLMAGLSVDMIYFALKAPDGRIAIPDIGPYQGGSINFSEFLFGFGYTKRSLAISFAGALVLPEKLVDDLSKVAVLGIRLPVQARLTFRLDVIPMAVGDVVVVLPLFQFNLDMRRTGVPALQDPTRCIPAWDGLQLFVGDRFRCGIRHIAFGPIFGMLPSINWVLSGDFLIGDEHNGLSIVLDESLQLGPMQIYVPIPLPGFADTTPFVNDCCVDVRLAGFGVHLHLQRPFPSISPFALPEIFALLSDPEHYSVNPRGELANCMRLSIFDTGITVPDAIAALFPAVRQIARPPVTETINLGTFIAATQKVFAVIKPVFETAAHYIGSAGRGPLPSGPALALPPLQPNDLVRLLPKSLQRIDTQVSFGGFDGRALVVLASAEEIAEAFSQRASASRQPVMPNGIAPRETFSSEALLNFQPGVNKAPPPSLADLIDDDIFNGFGPDDLAKPFSGMQADAVLIGARLRLLDQHVDFMGAISSAGAFSLIASAEQKPLQLSVAGVHLPLPFQPEGAGRLTISGRASKAGVSATVTAQGSARWDLLPHVIAASITDATLTLTTNRSFTLTGEVKLDLFDGKLVVDGAIDVGPTHAAVAGKLTSTEPWLDLGVDCHGSLGPLHAVNKPAEPAYPRDTSKRPDRQVTTDDIKWLIESGLISHADLSRLYGSHSGRSKKNPDSPQRSALKNAPAGKRDANIVLSLAQIAGLSNEVQIPLSSVAGLFRPGSRRRAPAASNGMVWLADVLSELSGGGKQPSEPTSSDTSKMQAFVGQGLEISGQGSIKLFGQTLAEAHIRVTGESLELAGEWGIADWQPFFRSVPSISGNLSARGVARLRDGPIGVGGPPAGVPTSGPAGLSAMWPDIQLEGHGQLIVQLGAERSPADVEIDGSARLEAGAEGLRLSASGALRWQGRMWGSGRLNIHPGGVQFGGHTTFTLEMPPTLPNTAKIFPRLVLRLDLNGDFEVADAGREFSYAFDLHWLLGAKLDNEQIFPLATGGLRFDSKGAVRLPKKLVDTGSFKIPGFDSLSLPFLVPDPLSSDRIGIGTKDGQPAVRIGDKVIKLETATLKVTVAKVSYSIRGPAIPKLEDGSLGSGFELQKLKASGPIELAWPFEPFSIELAFDQGHLLVLIHFTNATNGAETIRVRLSDGLQI
jgi:hypothetical protein